MFIISENNEEVIRYYRCKVCEETHKIVLKEDVIEGRTKYPFPYVVLHDSIKNGEIKEVLTILYIDQNFRIRGAEIQPFEDGNLFSKEQVVAITSALIEEINFQRRELRTLRKKLNQKDT